MTEMSDKKREVILLKEIYTALFSSAIVLLMFYMVKELEAKSTGEREKYLEDEKAVATVAEALLPLA